MSAASGEDIIEGRLHDMNVNSILNVKGRHVITVTSNVLINEVINCFATHKIGSIVVLDNGVISGIVSERDVVRSIAEKGADILSQPVSAIMTTGVKSCGGADSVHSIMEFMTSGRFRHMPVVEEGELVGIISIGDVVQYRIAEAEMEANSMRSYIATG